MQLISGTQMAAEIRRQLCRQNREKGAAPALAVILVGKQEDSGAYVKLKQKAAADIGGVCRVAHLAENITASQLYAEIESLNLDAKVHGIILQLPLPPHLQAQQDYFLQAISPEKDVDGFNPINRGLLIGGRPGFISCAALAAMEVIGRCLPDVQGRSALLIGDSFDLILPLTAILVEQGCQVRVMPAWHGGEILKADVVVAEKGSAHLIKARHLASATLLIDAGFYWTAAGVKGNVDNDDVAGIGGHLLPVPGGIGPLLIAKLMQNLSRAAWEQQDLKP
jgi:methylenetetrahydrofolate dehydrogenase (NADP+)/methenyltetrahydrofolate cyclohydrolase